MVGTWSGVWSAWITWYFLWWLFSTSSLSSSPFLQPFFCGNSSNTSRLMSTEKTMNGDGFMWWDFPSRTFYISWESLFQRRITCKYWLMTIVTEQLWTMANTTVQIRLLIQLNSVLFAKTLVRKDVASSAPPPSSKDSENTDTKVSAEDEDNFSSKAQIMTLMTTDVNRVSNFGWHILALVGSWYLLRPYKYN